MNHNKQLTRSIQVLVCATNVAGVKENINITIKTKLNDYYCTELKSNIRRGEEIISGMSHTTSLFVCVITTVRVAITDSVTRYT